MVRRVRVACDGFLYVYIHSISYERIHVHLCLVMSCRRSICFRIKQSSTEDDTMLTEAGFGTGTSENHRLSEVATTSLLSQTERVFYCHRKIFVSLGIARSSSPMFQKLPPLNKSEECTYLCLWAPTRQGSAQMTARSVNSCKFTHSRKVN